MYSKGKIIKKYKEWDKKFVDLEIWQDAVKPIVTVSSSLTPDKIEVPQDSSVKNL